MIRVSYISYVLLWFPSNIFFKQQTSTMNHHIDLRSWFAAFVVWIDRHGFLVASVGLCAFGVRMPGRIPENPPAAAKHRKNVAIILHLKSQSHSPFNHHWPLLTIVIQHRARSAMKRNTQTAHLWNGTMASGRHCSRATLHSVASPCQPMAWPDLGACRLETQSKAMGSLREQWNCSGQKLICF